MGMKWGRSKAFVVRGEFIPLPRRLVVNWVALAKRADDPFFQTPES
jgi:hypothetical protein